LTTATTTSAASIAISQRRALQSTAAVSSASPRFSAQALAHFN